MAISLPLKQAPQTICILRLSALGDVTHVVPVIRAIQHQWPSTEITWVCGAFESRLLEHIEDVRLVRFDKKGGWASYKKLWRELRGTRFDVLLHMQVSARANIASLGIRAKIRLGWDRMRSRDFHHLFTNQQIPEAHQQHQVLGFLSFAQALGIAVQRPEWDFPVLEQARQFVTDHINTQQKALLISPCSSHSRRNWHARGYAAVADYAVKQYGMQVVLCGGPSQLEKTMAAEIEQLMQHKPVNLVGKDTLQQLIALLQAADVVISPDSGPMHLANAVGTPVIGLHACTWSLRSGPFNSLSYCVDKFEQAAVKFLNTTPDKLRWGTRVEKPGVMDLIKIQDVIQKLDQFMRDQESTDPK